MIDSMMMAHTKIPITVASWERTSEPTATPSAASRAAPTTAPATWPMRVLVERATWSPWAATKMSPTPVAMIPATSPNSAPTLTAATVFGGKHPRPSRGGQVGEGGGGVAELAVGDDGPEHGGEEHGEAGDGGHGAQPVGGGDGRHAGAAGPGLVVLQEREQGGEGGSNGEQAVGEAHGGRA